MIPAWEDFTEKYGFEDGDGLTDQDFEARGKIITGLNEMQSFVKLVPFDRPGVHNACLIMKEVDDVPEALSGDDEDLLDEMLDSRDMFQYFDLNSYVRFIYETEVE